MEIEMLKIERYVFISLPNTVRMFVFTSRCVRPFVWHHFTHHNSCSLSSENRLQRCVPKWHVTNEMPKPSSMNYGQREQLPKMCYIKHPNIDLIFSNWFHLMQSNVAWTENVCEISQVSRTFRWNRQMSNVHNVHSGCGRTEQSSEVSL